MIVLMSRTWWIWALRGVAALLFGLAAFIWPEITLTALVLLYGAYALVDGLFSVVAAIAGRTAVRRWWVPFGECATKSPSMSAFAPDGSMGSHFGRCERV